MRGRPPLPTRILELRGAFKKHPERKRARAQEPTPEVGLGKPPKELDEAERARWREIAKMCSWLTIADRPIVEMTVQLWVKARKNQAEIGELKLLAQNYGQLGMTPAGRPRVKVPVAKPKANPFSKLRERA